MEKKLEARMEFLTATFQVLYQKIGDYTIGAVGQQLSYLVNYISNVDNLRTQVKKLEDARDRVQHRVEVSPVMKKKKKKKLGLKWLKEM